MIGQVIGQYRLIEKLGEGGMGAVYKGIDTMVEREVAIKMLRPDIAGQPELVERFRTEAITLAKLNSPGIATLYNFFREGDDYFMVMEFLAGRTLEQTLRHGGPMEWERAVPLFCRILQSIEPAHRAGILHRDIKPAKIMLTDRGGVKVMDFGIARVLGAARVTQVGRVIGTMQYISPERIQGAEADIRADIYSLAVVLYEMLSCHLPFESVNDFEIMRSHIHASPPALETYGVYVPAGIERAIMKALAKRTSERFGTCSEMEAALWNAMHAAGWRRPATPAMTLPQWSTGSAAGAALTGPAGAGLPETVLAGQGGSVSATTASRSLLDRLTWKHYAAAAVVALALGGGAMLAFHSFFPGSAARGSNAGQNAQPAVQSATTPPASSGPAAANSNASGNPATEPGAKAQIPPAQVAAPAASSQPAALAPGVYVLQDGKWAELLEESVNWKKGSPLRRLTLGLGKGEFVGSIPGAASPNGYRVPVTFRISTAEGFTADNYALVLLEAKGALREVRVGGSGASARSVRFTAKPVDTRVWELQFSQGAGEYGFLPPVREGDLPIAPRMYTFRVIP
jgi:tRNA A-37 threonylcarbamoyl transferase component Bud32